MKVVWTDLLEVTDNFEKFYDLFILADDEDKLDLLSKNDCEIFKRIYFSYDQEQLREIITEIPIGNNQQLILFVRQDWSISKERAQYALGQLLFIASDQVFNNPKISELCTLISKKDFKILMRITPRARLPKMFFLITRGRRENLHALQNVLTLHGSEVLSNLLNLLLVENEVQLRAELFLLLGVSKVYQKLLDTPGRHISDVINLIKDQLSFTQKESFIHEHHEKLHYLDLFTLLESMSPQNRKELLLSRLRNGSDILFIVNFVTNLGPNVDFFLELIRTLFNDEERFSFYTYPIYYRSVRRFAADQTVNSVISSLSFAAGKLLGPSVKSTVDSFTTEVDISEFLICQLFRANKRFYKAITGIFSEMYPRQCTTILRGETSEGLPLLFHVFLECSPADVIELLSFCAYHTEYAARLFVIDELWLENLRISTGEGDEGLVGFVTLMNLYNYLAVRSLEPGADVYQRCCDEFARMLVVFNSNLEPGLLIQALQQHKVHLGTSTVIFGSSRYICARDYISKLSESELSKGLGLFHEFIRARLEIRDKSLNESFNHDPRTQRLNIKLEDYTLSRDFEERINKILQQKRIPNQQSLRLI